MNKFAENLKKLRKIRGMTQSELAEQVFTSVQSVSRWETGESEPSIDTLILISTVLNTSLNELTGIDALPEEELFDGIAEYVKSSEKSNISAAIIKICRQIVRGVFNRTFKDEWKLNPKSRGRKTYSTIHKNGFGGLYSDRDDTPTLFAAMDIKNFDISTLADDRLPDIYSAYADKQTYYAILKMINISPNIGYDRKSFCEVTGISSDDFENITRNLEKAGLLTVKNVNINGQDTDLFFPFVNYKQIMMLAFVKLIYLNSTDGNA